MCSKNGIFDIILNKWMIMKLFKAMLFIIKVSLYQWYRLFSSETVRNVLKILYLFQVYFPTLKLNFPLINLEFPVLQFHFPLLEFEFPIFQFVFPKVHFKFPFLQIDHPNVKFSFPIMKTEFSTISIQNSSFKVQLSITIKWIFHYLNLFIYIHCLYFRIEYFHFYKKA